MTITHFIGIDVSKETLDFALIVEGEVLLEDQVANSKKGLNRMFTLIRKNKTFNVDSSVFCLEHTGIYNAVLLEDLLKRKARIWLENALQIKQSQGMQRGKSDKIDAKRIAQYAYTFRDQVKLWTPPRERVTVLKNLLTMRERIVNTITQLETPLNENAAFKPVEITRIEKSLFNAPLKALKKELSQVDKLIKKNIDDDPDLKRVFDLVTSVDGVGAITAANVIISTNEFKSINDPRKFACYSGIAPFAHQSGSSIRGRTRVSHLANKKIKRLLHMAALASIRMQGELKQYYQRQVEAGKNKMLVLNAIRNKIIHRIFAVVQRGERYQKNYQHQLA